MPASSPIVVLALAALCAAQPFSAPAPVTIWLAGSRSAPLVSTGIVSATPALSLTALNETVSLAWVNDAHSPDIRFKLTQTFTVTKASSSGFTLDPPEGPVALHGLAQAQSVPATETAWNATVSCTAGFSGRLDVELLVWNSQTGLVYAPVRMSVDVVCSRPGCDASCGANGHGSCRHLLGQCVCSDGFEGTGCTFKMDPPQRELCPAQPLQVDLWIPGLPTTGQEWIDVWCGGCVFPTDADWRYVWPWSQHIDTRIPPPKQETLLTLLTPGTVYLSVYRSTFASTMGWSTYRIKNWSECGYDASCASDTACGGGQCVKGSCQCPDGLWGARCERGCTSNVTRVFTARNGTIRSDRGAKAQNDSFYTQNSQCAWAVSPQGRRGKDWDYIHISFEFIDLGDGDSIDVLRGADPKTAVLDTSFTSSSPPVSWKIRSASALIRFNTDFSNGGNGFMIKYKVEKDPDYTLVIALPVAIGGALLLGAFGVASAYGCIYCRKRGRKDPKPLNLPVEAELDKPTGISFSTVTPFDEVMTVMASTIASGGVVASPTSGSSDGQIQMVKTPVFHVESPSTTMGFVDITSYANSGANAPNSTGDHGSSANPAK
eukprot:m51a1_g11393 hypothetical protein (603) ;mRNA; f:16317-18748